VERTTKTQRTQRSIAPI